MDILGELPLEIAQIILMYLNPEDLVNIYSVSTRWRQLVNHDRVWVKHMPYRKYVEKYWRDILGESYDEGEGCRLMKKYLTEFRIKNNMKQGNYNVITNIPSSRMGLVVRLFYRQIWSTGGDPFLSNGDLLKFKDTPSINPKDVNNTLSSDLRLLAVPYTNFLYIYERKPPTVEFELLSLLAAIPLTEEEPDGSIMMSLVSCPKLDKESVAVFISKYYSEDRLEFLFFTGVDSPAEPRVCLRIDAKIDHRSCSYEQIYAVWDVDRNRLVHRWNGIGKVMEGWDRRGVCITYETKECADNRIEFYDVDMRPLTVIPIKGYRVEKLVVSYNFTVAVIQSFDYNKESLVMWEKDSTEYRVLVENFYERIVAVSPSTVAYQLDKDTVTIIAAPDWQVLAHVETDYQSFFFHLSEYSDGSLFIVLGTEEGNIWHNIERRNTTEISEWPINSGHKFNLPENSQIVFNNGAKLAILTGKFPNDVVRIIDYNK